MVGFGGGQSSFLFDGAGLAQKCHLRGRKDELSCIAVRCWEYTSFLSKRTCCTYDGGAASAAVIVMIFFLFFFFFLVSLFFVIFEGVMLANDTSSINDSIVKRHRTDDFQSGG